MLLPGLLITKTYFHHNETLVACSKYAANQL
jgi:hypothetical protein